ncbi:alpha/beta hydrolase family protein [Actinomadura harenae]|uniref:Alpha/beta fold hydrolase n=1 Tax=Actinomadura harenae TaxID=2483351 RepID=A0A3M2LU98_9ACTN|nr:alpha/beta fold hydrolase [Actinomadura harenae]RMI40113.1 alpha/beta fold hydrolase [Actinomadura harenae]
MPLRSVLTAAKKPAKPARRPLSPGRLLVSGLTAVLLLAFAASVAIGWYFSGVATQVDHGRTYDLRVRAVGDGTVTLPRTDATTRPGVFGLEWAIGLRDGGGRAIIGEVVRKSESIAGMDTGTIVRKVLSVPSGKLEPGLTVGLDHWVYHGDPKKALGLDFQNVTYPSQVGAMPAWLVPGRTKNSTWVIAVHGHNADRAETFRAMKTVHDSGMPMLSISYRNDRGAPPGANGRNLLGSKEWNDVASAIAYARSQGATGVVLYGWSMGGWMAMSALQHAPDPSFVRGVVLDSPVLDWRSTLHKQGSSRGLPSLETDVAMRMLTWRYDVDLGAMDLRPFAPRLKTPTLLFTAGQDGTVDNGPSLEFARKAPAGMVTQVAEPNADHTEAWNVDSSGYEQALSGFLSKTAS